MTHEQATEGTVIENEAQLGEVTGGIHIVSRQPAYDPIAAAKALHEALESGRFRPRLDGVQPA